MSLEAMEWIRGLSVCELGGSLPGALCGSHLGSLGMSVTAWRSASERVQPDAWGWDWCKHVRAGEPTPTELAKYDVVIDGRPLETEPVRTVGVLCRILGDWNTGIEKMPEVVVQSITGFTGYVGNSFEQPIRVGAPVVTLSTGVAAAHASLAGLLWRRRSDAPCHVTVTAVGVGVALLGNNITSESEPDARTGFAGEATAAPVRGVPCADGIVDFTFFRENDGFRRFCQWLGRGELADDERFASLRARRDHAEELDAVLLPLLATRQAGDVLAQLEAAGAACSRMFEVAELVSMHPQVQVLDMLRFAPEGGGKRALVQLPWLINGDRPPLTPIDGTNKR
jgi:crotonobetainyl-CoA:carnitine CoA-transferase CaiB-like acyl-CoA transferase